MLQGAANGHRSVRGWSANSKTQVVQGFERNLAAATLSVDEYLATLPPITDIVESRGKYAVANFTG
jgi:hypothetical protein